MNVFVREEYVRFRIWVHTLESHFSKFLHALDFNVRPSVDEKEH